MFVIKKVTKVKNTVPWKYVISDINAVKLVARFYENELQKRNQKEFRVDKIIKRDVTNYMLNGKVMIILLIVGLIKAKYHYIKWDFFLKLITVIKIKYKPN